MTSFHTHTFLCKHAIGAPWDYAGVALKEGCTGLGFSDHCPYPKNEVWNYCRMDVGDVPLYKMMVRKVQEVVEFPVFLGFECEWLDKYKSWYEDRLIGEAGAQYLVFGSHWFPRDGELVWAPYLQGREVFDYIDFTISGLKTGLYDFLAHPDLFLARCTHIDSDLLKASADLIDACIGLNIPIEINGAGTMTEKIVRDGREEYGYPAIAFWEIARDKNATIICNSDAHNPQDVLRGARSARSFAETLGIEVVDFLPFLQKKLSKTQH